MVQIKFVAIALQQGKESVVPGMVSKVTVIVGISTGLPSWRYAPVSHTGVKI